MQITRRLEWDMGHRVQGHEGECSNPHGHRYAAEIAVSGEVHEDGMVIDFGKVKGIVGDWINHHLDHTTAYEQGDLLLGEYAKIANAFECKPFFAMHAAPTAENLAILILDAAIELLSPHGIAVVGVRVYETPNCWADAP
jgi:6-pyruvoyltetrahydropterin/6-carboxytetrahydropterin synthase